MRRCFILSICCLLSWSLFGAGKDKGDGDAVRSMNHYVFENELGEKVTLASLDSDYVFLEMWSMSCRPCLLEMEFFKDLPARYSDKSIRFVSICVENNVPLWKKFLKQRKIGGIQWVTPLSGAFREENGFHAVPHFILVDRQGKIVWRNARKPSDPALKTDLDKLFIKY